MKLLCIIKIRMSEKKLNLFLDLDQTLISAEAEEEYDFNKNKSKSKLFNYHDMDGYYIIFERPGLQEFLDYVFKKYNVSIWTAASKDYALFIIDKIILKNKPERKLDYIFFAYHCELSKKHNNNSKDLSILWSKFGLTKFNNDNTVILDDYDEVYDTQPNNCIRAKPFYFLEDNSNKDTFLKDVLTELKSSTKNKK